MDLSDSLYQHPSISKEMRELIEVLKISDSNLDSQVEIANFILGKEFKQEREDRERRKQDLIRVYEQLVEGRPEIVHKLVEDFIEPTNYVAAQQRLEPIINFDKLINSL